MVCPSPPFGPLGVSAGPVPSRRLRLAVRVLAFAAAALLIYAAWRGYQNPDLLLDFANLRLC